MAGSFDMFVTTDKTLVLVTRKACSKWYSVVCIGRKGHYRKHGDCKHTDEIFAAMKPKIRKRTTVKGFGGKGAQGD